MAYFSYSSLTGEILQISDFEIVLGNDMAVSFTPLSKATLEAEYVWDSAARDFTPRPVSNLSRLEFMRRFTASERIAAREAAKTDPIIFDALEILGLAEFISVTDPDTISLVNYLVFKGLLAPERVPEILN